MERHWRSPLRAHRYDVSWPVRVRRVNEERWHPAHTVNLSVTGVLIRTQDQFNIGERVELEIEFVTHPERNTIISTIGHIVREDPSVPGAAAIEFVTDLTDA